MNDATIGRNYAETLMVLAKRSGDEEKWGTLIEDFGTAMRADHMLRTFLESPKIAASQKIAIVEKALGTRVPPLFLKFIGLAEAAGALGLILPGLLRIRRELTPLAAAGLVIIMIGATALTAAGGQVGPAIVPGLVGLLAAFVAYKRWQPTRGPGALLIPARQAA